jgi:CDP-glucose 4,6-dehydratase
MQDAFGGYYRGKTVFVTGHTGFKGSWLAAWLTELGAGVVGYSLDPPTTPSHFAAAGLAGRAVDLRGDVRDGPAVAAAMRTYRPDIVFHLAAQALVRPALERPVDTFHTNVMGTVNVLEAAVHCDSVRAIVSITSDKCYENREWVWGYRETDALGGHDPYGASKAAAELVINVYRDRRFQGIVGADVPVASTRAGNVVGGGDWATDRLVPDILRAVSAGRDLVIRHPDAVRPWQHVLEPLSGYLWLGSRLARDGGRAFADSWNFGPSGTEPVTVADLATAILDRWASGSRVVIERDTSGAESIALRLDSSRAAHRLGWLPTWSTCETVDAIVEWYRSWLADPSGDVYGRTVAQIERYAGRAADLGRPWAIAKRGT